MLRLIYVLAATVRLHEMESNAEELTGLLELVMRIQAVGKWAGWPEPAPDIDTLEAGINGTQDTCIKGILKGLLELSSIRQTQQDDVEDATPPGLQQTLDKLQNSKIGSLAREIAEEIDFSPVDSGAPGDWLDLSNIGNPNSFLGGVVEKLSTKLNTKMQSGDLKQEDLLSDAFSLLQSMGMGAPGASAGMPGGMDLLSMMSSLTGQQASPSSARGGCKYPRSASSKK